MLLLLLRVHSLPSSASPFTDPQVVSTVCGLSRAMMFALVPHRGFQICSCRALQAGSVPAVRAGLRAVLRSGRGGARLQHSSVPRLGGRRHAGRSSAGPARRDSGPGRRRGGRGSAPSCRGHPRPGRARRPLPAARGGAGEGGAREHPLALPVAPQRSRARPVSFIVSFHYSQFPPSSPNVISRLALVAPATFPGSTPVPLGLRAHSRGFGMRSIFTVPSNPTQSILQLRVLPASFTNSP